MKDGGKDLKKAGFLILSALLYHILVTLQEVLLGLSLGLGAAIITGYFLAKSSAVEREIVGADKGLGFLVNVGRGLYSTALVFVAVFPLVLPALGPYRSVVFLESRVLSWRKSNGE